MSLQSRHRTVLLVLSAFSNAPESSARWLLRQYRWVHGCQTQGLERKVVKQGHSLLPPIQQGSSATGFPPRAAVQPPVPAPSGPALPSNACDYRDPSNDTTPPTNNAQLAIRSRDSFVVE